MYSRIVVFMVCITLVLVLDSCTKNTECEERCQQLPDVGPCDAAFTRYYYDQDSMACLPFLWGGCGGQVPFESLADCEACNCEE